MFSKRTVVSSFAITLATAFLMSTPLVYAASAASVSVSKHWTKERRDSAIPRDLVIDHRGLGYLRKRDGSLLPYGHTRPARLSANKQTPFAKPPGAGGSGSSDTTPPVITNMAPAEGSIIGASQLFSATITDNASGIKSVSFVVTYPDGVTTQTFRPGYAGNNTWEITLQGFSNGDWRWHAEATDGAGKGGNTATSATINFTVDTGDTSGGGSGGGESYIVTNAIWDTGGAVQTAAGRIYFEMPGNSKRKGRWTGYVCSGTVANDDSTAGRSVIITAAHCIYDDANKAFARNVLFIPNQDGTTGSGTDKNCNNDPLGCWTPSFGVVDVNWTTTTFPNNIEWDYAYYVVSDTDAHVGAAAPSNSLDIAAGSLAVSFLTPNIDDGDPSATSIDFTHAMGYSYNNDPNLMYCAEDMTTEGTVNWWLASCDLSGGSSGGPWIQPMDVGTGSGPITSVNSWGYTSAPGMAGPKLDNTSAGCLFTEAKGIDFVSVSNTDGEAGMVIDYCP